MYWRIHTQIFIFLCFSTIACGGGKSDSSDDGIDAAESLEVGPTSGEQPDSQSSPGPSVVPTPIANGNPTAVKPKNPSTPPAPPPAPTPVDPDNSYTIYYAHGFVSLAFSDHIASEDDSVSWGAHLAPQKVGSLVTLSTGYKTQLLESE